MVKLNEDAFAAVNDAFPDAAKNAFQKSASGNPNNAATTDGARKGVGASAVESSASGADTSDVIHKRLLKIGSKKRKTLVQEEEERKEDQQGAQKNFDDRKKPCSTNMDLDSDDDDDEEDLGRTAIDKGSKSVSTPPSLEQQNVPESGKRKKKKLGKKEREAEKSVSTEPVVADDSAEKPARKEILCGADAIEDQAKNTKKRKRPKLRSKQKNIRKDTRVNKPAHLVPGNGDYRGRPLTAETRKRLNMAESRRETKLKAYWSNQNRSGGERPGEAKP